MIACLPLEINYRRLRAVISAIDTGTRQGRRATVMLAGAGT